MPRRYYRRRQSAESDALLGIAATIVIAVIVEYHRLTTQMLELVIAGAILLVGIVVSLVIFLYVKRTEHDRKKLRALSTIDINTMDGLAFEKYVAELLKNQGYSH